MSTTCDIAPTPSDGVRAPNPEMLPTKILVVGGGMAAHGFCKSMVSMLDSDTCEITVFAEEPHLAYDRVNLSKLFDGRSKEDLILSDQSWYDDHRINFKTSCRIGQIDRKAKQVIDQAGNRYGYDKLVLATGSHPFVPPVPGKDLSGVFVYRTLDDLADIQAHVEKRKATTGAVIGGGLLGLEAAKILHDLGLKTSVIEMAPGLMPRQLDHDAAIRLRAHVESIGVDVHLVRRTERIKATADGGLIIDFSNADSQNIDVLIIAAGVRPNDAIAKDAGLRLGERGGIAVNQSLETSDPNIFAIGECAAFADHIYGLVAPCYRMAETLAQRLSGQDALFHGADESAELKLMGVQVVTLGRAIGQSTSGIVLSQEDDDAYRKLIIEQGKVVGAACVGPWVDLPQVRQAIHRQKMLWPIQRARFKKTGSPWISDGSMTVHQWPADAIVCSCMGISRGVISTAIEQGSDSIEQIAEVTKASTACGSCKSLVCELVGGDTARQAVPGAKTMLAASIVAAIFTLLVLALPPVQMATSVQSAWRKIDVLWRATLLAR